MNVDKNNENLDELISGAIGRKRPQFDFNKWKREHQDEIKIYESRKTKSGKYVPNTGTIIPWRKVVYVAAALMITMSLAACMVLSEKVAKLQNELEKARREIDAVSADDSKVINFYMREHQDIIARKASLNSADIPPVQMYINRHDMLYYEFFDDEPEFVRPGIIVRRPSYQSQVSPPEAPAISNGHTLTLSEARQAADFILAAPPRLFPGYSLDQIRKIEGRDAMQLLYTNGINSISLFEQPLDGQRGLEPKDFREYAVFQNKGKAGGTILAWKDNALSYVLIGNVEMSQLMNMAQSISAGK
jgi:hypothetical protein